mmetsp:Transcript_142919/g.398222  ORF Transcript_142919/g.398222 Transcript_142919/m.398222 type:complete len:376 (-) Transcript_142919:7-1134(-)
MFAFATFVIALFGANGHCVQPTLPRTNPSRSSQQAFPRKSIAASTDASSSSFSIIACLPLAILPAAMHCRSSQSRSGTDLCTGRWYWWATPRMVYRSLFRCCMRLWSSMFLAWVLLGRRAFTAASCMLKSSSRTEVMKFADLAPASVLLSGLFMPGMRDVASTKQLTLSLAKTPYSVSIPNRELSTSLAMVLASFKNVASPDSLNNTNLSSKPRYKLWTLSRRFFLQTTCLTISLTSLWSWFRESWSLSSFCPIKRKPFLTTSKVVSSCGSQLGPMISRAKSPVSPTALAGKPKNVIVSRTLDARLKNFRVEGDRVTLIPLEKALRSASAVSCSPAQSGAPASDSVSDSTTQRASSNRIDGLLHIARSPHPREDA